MAASRESLESKIDEIAIPYLPLQVDAADLQPDGRLLNESHIHSIKEQLKDEPLDSFKKHKKAILKTPYSVIQGPKNFVIYKGAKCNKALGNGVFGKAKLIQDMTTGKWSVVKAIFPNNFSPSTTDKMAQIESTLLNIVHGTENSFLYSHQSIKYGKTVNNLVMPFIKGTRFSEQPPVSFIRSLHFTIDLLKNIHFLHEKNILHMDIGEHNVLCDSAARKLHLIDFGLSRQMNSDQEYIPTRTRYPNDYRAPEVEEDNICTPKTEMYALGQTLILWFSSKMKDFFSGENPWLPIALRIDFFQHLFLMKEPDASKRPTFNQSIAFFTAFIKKLPQKYRQQYIGILRVKDAPAIVLANLKCCGL